ncbi:hypothetical protein AX14_000971 [Amanita brunnescens Koide BX004]|nr:hypothetical protein AX14_000971 [Amanita brunnescens Koide BX004]
MNLHQFASQLARSEIPEHLAIASEIEALQAIYGDDAVQLWGDKSDSIRYAVTLSLPHNTADGPVNLRLLVSLPPTYPSSAPPQLQLLSKYIGNFGADSALFGAILRTVVERCTLWYEDRLSSDRASGPVRMDEKEEKIDQPVETKHTTVGEVEKDLPVGIEIHVAEPIVDRKSVFVGRACRITDSNQVPQILSVLRADRRIARAAHPTIWAYRCQAGNTLYQDNDDDGETAAGGRLAHLLQILELDDILVVVTRYFGGVHLGPDRFKHINNAARNALDIGGFLDSLDTKQKH